VAQGHAKLTEIALRQLRQNFGVDLALTEHRFILSETEAAQPTADIHGRIPNRLEAMIHPDDKACPGHWSGTVSLG